jgi:hypothetical protein
MKRLLWIGNPFFCRGMETHGWSVIQHCPGLQETLDWEDCLRLAGGLPDALVIGDASRPPFVLGVERFPCFTVFYAVDTHIHSWMPWYAQAFDACLISLKDHIPFFANKRLPSGRLWWSPPFAPDSPDLFPETDRTGECLFVGTVDPERMPLRSLFLEKLAALVPGLEVRQGDFQRLYPTARVAVNFCEHGDLNFRVFESMGCGAALVTPSLGHGQAELFEEGRHLLTFPIPGGDDGEGVAAGAARGAAERINLLLGDEGFRASLARAGFAEVNAFHRARHRAERFHELVSATGRDFRDRRGQAGGIRNAYLRFVYLLLSESMAATPLGEVYLKAARGEL